jgi:hypothetical protein
LKRWGWNTAGRIARITQERVVTIDEAVKIVRQRWEDNDGCRSCSRKPLLLDFEPVEDCIDEEDLKRGYVNFPCSGDDGTDVHRGIRVYIK